MGQEELLLLGERRFASVPGCGAGELRIAQLFARMQETGGAVWASGELLCRWACTQAAARAQPPTTVLELGAGPGLTSIALARAGAARVVATDGEPASLALCARNAALNGVADAALQTRPLRWGAGAAARAQLDAALLALGGGGGDDDDGGGGGGGGDDDHKDEGDDHKADAAPPRCAQWIVASDVLYDEGAQRDLEATLRLALLRGGCELVALGWQARGVDEEAFLLRLADLGAVSTAWRSSDAEDAAALRVGDAVEANFEGAGSWFPAVVTAVGVTAAVEADAATPAAPDGALAFDVRYTDDSDDEGGVPASRVRRAGNGDCLGITMLVPDPHKCQAAAQAAARAAARAVARAAAQAAAQASTAPTASATVPHPADCPVGGGAYYINMAARVDRRRQMEAMAASSGIALRRVEAATPTNCAVVAEAMDEFPGKPPAYLANAESHAAVWALIAGGDDGGGGGERVAGAGEEEEEEEEMVLVLEDDVCMHSDWSGLLAAALTRIRAAEPPGACAPGTGLVDCFLLDCIFVTGFQCAQHGWLGPPEEGEHRADGTAFSDAYALSRSAAHWLLARRAAKPGCSAESYLMQLATARSRCWTHLPRLAVQRWDDSDVAASADGMARWYDENYFPRFARSLYPGLENRE